MKLLANGDSQTYGHGLTEQGSSATWPINGTVWDNQTVERNCSYALKHSWPAQLSSAIGYDCQNISRPGGSNDRIVRTTLQYLAKQGYKDTVVVIGWTNPDRREVHVEEEIRPRYGDNTGYKAFWASGHDEFKTAKGEKWAENYYRYGWDPVESHVRFYSQVLLLTAYLKLRNIPYLYFNGINSPQQWQQNNNSGYAANMTDSLYAAINWDDFVSIDGTVDEIIWGKFNSYLDEQQHLTEQGHRAFSELLEWEMQARGMI